MLTVRTPSEIPQTGKPVILAMGCFDGVHIGHQKVISTAVAQAAAIGGEAWVYTFNPHPAKVLNPHMAPPLISAPPCRMRQLRALGVQGLIEIPFTMAFAQIEPQDFLDGLRQNIPALKGIVCGADWSFGRRAAGKIPLLEAFCREHGMTATAVEPVLYHGEKVSSTHIRKAIQTGHIPLAGKMLGRPFCLFGTVINGRKIGRDLGWPTANIHPLNELIPAPGVYAAYTTVTEIGGQRSEIRDQRSAVGGQEGEGVQANPFSGIPSAVFIGTRATFNDPEPVIESHLLDFSGDLYGRDLEICLVEKTRDVEPFPSKEALIEQIARDIAQIRALLQIK